VKLTTETAADSLAAVLVVNSYHHFEQYEAMDQQILRLLKPEPF